MLKGAWAWFGPAEKPRLKTPRAGFAVPKSTEAWLNCPHKACGVVGLGLNRVLTRPEVMLDRAKKA